MNLQIESNQTNRTDVQADLTRNKLVEEHWTERYSPPSFSLDAAGYIQKCGQAIEKLFGYQQDELVWQHISCLFPKFTEVTLLQDKRLNPQLSYLCHCDHEFEAINKQSDVVTCNLNFFLVENKGQQNVRLIVRPVARQKSMKGNTTITVQIFN
jgi:PAS domain S-box-containing protein